MSIGVIIVVLCIVLMQALQHQRRLCLKRDGDTTATFYVYYPMSRGRAVGTWPTDSTLGELWHWENHVPVTNQRRMIRNFEQEKETS